MGLFTRWRRRRAPYAAVTDEEQIARYLYLLNTLPPSVLESAHASAFRDVPAARRREMFEQLRPFMSESERSSADDDPVVLAKLVRRAQERRAARDESARAKGATTSTIVDGESVSDGLPDMRRLLMSSGVMLIVANQVLVSAAVHSYFTVGAGSLGLEGEPGWVGEMVDPGSVFAGDGGLGAGGFAEGSIGMDGGGLGGFDGGGLGGF